jgi:alpha-beta hydrolase superfamily lysophospholipase
MIQEARALAEAGYKVITPDLPAHGARYKEVLTLQSAISTLHEVITKEAAGQKVRALWVLQTLP